MDQNRFIWDEVSEGLILPRVQKIDDEQIKKRTIQSEVIDPSEIYCPHNYLILNFHETLNPSQKIKFRKYYLRKVGPNEPDVIILQDIKDLVMFLLISPVSVKFINFFHLPVVDHFLRALIIYFQYYIEIWEKLMEERVATLKKAPNPLAGGHRIKYADELHILRCMLSKEYADLIVGCQDTIHYHHIISGKKRSSMTQSQGEKDLRIFEVLIHISHRVVWIALHRKHFHLIGMIDVDTCDPRIAYLHNALLIEEEMLPKLGIKIGILGQERSNYDLMLMLLDSENSSHVENISKAEKSYDKKNNITNNQTQNNLDCNQNIMRMPSFELQPALTEVFEVKKIDKSTRKYSKFREDARKKWIIRQTESHSKQLDTYSIMTII
ncbi:uncharacterized protein LOC124956875 isoform X2 [Vespa velutina]|uniref:uncharacterized protein LOC124956875 isoform X2 n=1 Tax=Vespa velutina TaxID=202808 RepID=UPI001FB2A842|nr:uncharacterized protein LOC124956875 isoform X2 [Vespa velutina]